MARRASIKKTTISRAQRENDAAAKQVAAAALNGNDAFKKAMKTRDSFQNFALNLGMGTSNGLTFSTYGYNPLTNNRVLLEFIYRGSWLGGMAIDLAAEDMTRGGIEITATNDPEQVEHIHKAFTIFRIWESFRQGIKWSRLYGGAILVLLIDGQQPDQPLRLQTITKGQFKGMLCLDRWQVNPSLDNLVTDLGPELGKPKFYSVVADAPAYRGLKIHHSRVVRLEGQDLPYWQRVMNNGWGLSVLERLYDRMIAFDSATQGASQLVYKSFIRTYGVKGWRDAHVEGGDAVDGILRQIAMMTQFQGIEGITVMDADDIFATHQSSFAGIGDALTQFGQQISGALQIPLVRLFGQSPAGLNSTGESDLRTYYDGIKQSQENDLRDGVNLVLNVLSRSIGIELDTDYGFNFNSLWQMNDQEKSEVSDRDTKSILEVEAAGFISKKTGLKELRQHSKSTGRFTNITDEMIEEASDEIEAPPPPGMEEGMPGDPHGGEAPQGAQKPAGPEQQQSGGTVGAIHNLHQMEGALGKTSVSKDLLYSAPKTFVAGLEIVIEQAAGTVRSGEYFSVILPCDYGYIRRVGSAEGEQEWLDCFVGEDLGSRKIWIIDSNKPDGTFDEHKVALGFTTRRDALAAFNGMYNDFRKVGGVTELSVDSLAWKRWLDSGDKNKPASHEFLREMA